MSCILYALYYIDIYVFVWFGSTTRRASIIVRSIVAHDKDGLGWTQYTAVINACGFV